MKLAEDHRNCTTVDVSDGDICIAIVTPLMRRVHQHPEAEELVFVDSGGNVDRSQARVFLFMTHSVRGGLPLGVVITNSETEATLTKAFQLLRDMLPDGMLQLTNCVQCLEGKYAFVCYGDQIDSNTFCLGVIKPQNAAVSKHLHHATGVES